MLITSCKKEQAIENKIPGSFKALELFTKVRAYPEANIPKQGYMSAYVKHKDMLSEISLQRENSWEGMGPFNTSGRCLTVGINPQAPRTIYGGFASGGIWRSRNFGLERSWQRIETGFPVLGVSTIEFAHQDSTVMFIGTGEVYSTGVTGNDGAYRATRGSYGIGILKSTDGGETWTHSLDWSYNQNEGVWMVKIARTNSQLVYAATTQGVLKSIDQGETWENIFENPMVTDLEIHPNNPNQIVISCGNFDSTGKGIYSTIDGGNTWENSSGVPDSFLGKILLARSESNPEVLYASVGNGFSGADGYTWLLKSTDNGENFITVNETDYSRWQGWFSHDVSVHPNDENELIAIGIDIHKSEDGGTTLTAKSNIGLYGVTLGEIPVLGPDGPPGYSHSDHHFVRHHPEIDSVVLFGNDGGVFISFDRGETFRSANAGLQTTQFYNGFSASNSNPDLALGGLQDNSTSIFNGTDAWKRDVGGDGSWTAINEFDNSILYASSQFLRITRSNNGGEFFINVSPVTNGDSPLFIAPFVISKTNPNILYAAGEYLYKTFDGANSWEKVNGGEKLNGDPIYALDVSPIDDEIIYAGTAPENQPAALMVSIDGGDSFTEVSPLSDKIVNDISIFPNSPESAIAVYSGFDTPHVFRTDDYGASWNDITNNLPDVPTNAVIINPYNEKEIYIGNDLGVYYSTDGGDNWTPYQVGLPTAVIVLDLKISTANNKLWAATHGNGTYRVDLETQPVSTQDTDFTSVNVYPNPTTGSVNIDGLSYSNFKLEVHDNQGVKVYENTNQKEVDLSFLNSGMYIISLSLPESNQTITKTIIKH